MAPPPSAVTGGQITRWPHNGRGSLKRGETTSPVRDRRDGGGRGREQARSRTGKDGGGVSRAIQVEISFPSPPPPLGLSSVRPRVPSSSRRPRTTSARVSVRPSKRSPIVLSHALFLHRLIACTCGGSNVERGRQKFLEFVIRFPLEKNHHSLGNLPPLQY